MGTFLNVLEEDGIAVVDDFVTPSECNLMLRELEFTHWADSSVVNYIGDENSPAYFSKIRKSQTSGQIWFSDVLNEALAVIEERLALLLASSRKHFEEWKATRYGKGDRFDYHVDGGN